MKDVEITCLYDKQGNCVFIDSKKESKIQKLIKQGKSVKGVDGVIEVIMKKDINTPPNK